MSIDFLIHTFEQNSDKDAIIWRDQVFSYGWLLSRLEHWRRYLIENEIMPSSIISIEADYSPNSVALLLALIEHKAILVPLTKSVEMKKEEFREIAEVEVIITLNEWDDCKTYKRDVIVKHELLLAIKLQSLPGLILYSSGSTGKSKAALHNLEPLLEKYKTPRHSLRTITFLLFDHIGGVNTLLYTLSNAGTIVTLEDRLPGSVCAAIEKYSVEILPTSPTFINLMLLSGIYKDYNLSSLQTVTYGTEVMPESTLKKFNKTFPQVKLLQTYGLSEVGILRSKSKSSDSLWVKVGGEGFETRIVESMLEIRTKSAMIGYLNAPSPFTEDGWFKTEDMVEVDGDYILIKGRNSEIINVGGEKVYPAEVESVLLMMDDIEDVIVSGEPNPIMGQIVKVKVKLSTEETLQEFRRRMREYCEDKLPAYKIPQKILIADQTFHGSRFKKMRKDQ
jgi:long-chain acyl-CoA synthetase